MTPNAAKRKTFTIFSQRLAGYLMLRGFVLAGIGKSDVDPTRSVFHFYDSNELRNAIKSYKGLKGGLII